MDERHNPQTSVWATFGILVLIALVAWSMGSTGLALALGAGATGSILVTVVQRRPRRRAEQRVAHIASPRH
ncbi:hypothetical protein [Fimbriimonas ginsengisoli]|uniref:hypothetical protein n=1 Tax=Fimbriimonas ginsengisoli TaxID=1005039 RepID=UPI001185185B|nr:hypothetical protein [Fimbriimonas ginsengisoli]